MNSIGALVCVSLILAVGLNVLAENPNLTQHVSDQIARLKSLGYDASRLDDHTQLRVFLYTWLGIERGEGGYCPSKKTSCTSTKFYNCYQIGEFQSVAKCFRALGCTKSPDCPAPDGMCINFVGAETIGCCDGWIQIMGICTRSEWYNGVDGSGIKSTIESIRRVIQV